MNICGVQQNAAVVCPKPRRVGVLNHHPALSLRWQLCHQVELCESNSRNEVLDFIFTKGVDGCEQDPTQTVMTSSSPPLFFSGSPPIRVSNPLTKDSIFRDELLAVAQISPTPREIKPSSPMNNGGGGCVRTTSFVNKPVVRVVGFDCLDRDRRSSSNRGVLFFA
ncbi:unnamed protein product [Cochlearia groenlandica]